MVYADYIFYICVYGGAELEEWEFRCAIRDASAYLDLITFGRLKQCNSGMPNEVKMAACAVAEAIYRDGQHQGITSENVDGYAVTYTAGKRDLTEVVDRYILPSSPLRYAGVT